MTTIETTASIETPKALKARVTAVLLAANAAPRKESYGPRGGCGRAYVCISSTNGRKTINAVAAACKALGLMFLRKAYGVGNNAIYIGYDNATGTMLAKSDAFAEALNAQGIACYTDAHGD